MEINIEELQEQLNESKAIEPPKSMKRGTRPYLSSW